MDGLAVTEPVVPDAGVVAGVVLGVGVGVVIVGVGVVGVAEGLDDGAGSCSGSHDCSLAGVARLGGAGGRLTPRAPASRTPPATRATAAGRWCANRMNAYRCSRYCSERLTRLRQSYPVSSADHKSGPASRPALGGGRGDGWRRSGINEQTVKLQPLCVA